MKKFLYTAALLAALSPGLTFAATTYDRSPAGDPILSPVTLTVSFDDWADITCGSSAPYWGVTFYDVDTVVDQYADTPTISSSTQSGIFVFTLAPGTYEDPLIFCSNDAEGQDQDGGDTLTDPMDTWTVYLAPGLFSLPASMVPSISDDVSDTVAGPGLLLVIVAVLSLPVVFWLIGRVKALFPKGK